jgi:hypothetical protein
MSVPRREEPAERMFFSEEKNQKTFISPPLPTYPAMAGMHPPAQTQKSFGSFLQKRTALIH